MNKNQKFEKIQTNENLIEFEIRGSKFTLIPKNYGFEMFAIIDSLIVCPGNEKSLRIGTNGLLLKIFQEKQGEKNVSNNND